MMDYKKLVKKAGYKGDQADYLARKISEQKQVRTKEDLLNLPAYFRSEWLAGISTYELSRALYDAAIEEDATPAAAELAKAEGVDVATVKPTGKGGRVTKADVESVVNEE